MLQIGTSRKSIFAYYYTLETPPQIGPDHSTVYTPPPVMSGKDEFEQSALAEEWNALLKNAQREQHELANTIDSLERQLDEARSAIVVPFQSYLEQIGPTKGFYSGRWTVPELYVRFRTYRSLRSVIVKAYYPAGRPCDVLAFVDSELVLPVKVGADGIFSFEIPVIRDAGTEFELRLSVSPPYRSEGDSRELDILPTAIEARHEE